jgi:soluble lytic murein transglycosylase
MNPIARQLLIVLSALVFLALLLGLLSASPETPASPEPPPPQLLETNNSLGKLPWEPFRHPGDELVRVSTIVQDESSSAKDKLSQLSLLTSEDEPPLVHGLADFATGLVLLDARRPNEAAASFLSPSIDSTELSAHALYFASGAIDDSKPEQAIDLLDRLITKYSDFALINEARLRRGRLLARERRREEAAALFRDILADGQEDVRDEGLFELASVLVELGQKQEAAKLLEELYYEMPTSLFARDAGRKLTSLRKRLPAREADELYRQAFERAELLYEHERYRDAYNAYTSLLSRFKGEVDKDLVNLRRGVCQYRRRQSSTADKILQQIKRTDLKPEATYYRALADRRRRRRQNYQVKLAEVLSMDPKGPWAEEALWSLASYHEDHDETATALDYCRKLVKEFPNGKNYVRAQWRLLWDQYRQRMYREAAVGFERVAREHPAADELPQFLYWGARAHESSGQVGRAVALYQQVLLGFKNTYYGRRAEEHLTQLGGVLAPIVAVEEARAGIDLKDALGVYRTDRQTRIAQLLAMGLYEEATLEATRSVDGDGDPAFLATVAWIRLQQGRVREAIFTMRRAFPFHTSATGDLLPRAIWQIIYPLRYWDLVERFAHEERLDPYLVAALIRQESTFNARVRSRAGARGLMQIMPATGKIIAREQRRRYRSSDLYKPDVNIRFGTHYFRKMLDRFGGRVDYALASYNAGPHRVRAWTRMDLNLDPEEFIEEIPFTETRKYVKLVLRNEMLYRRIYYSPEAVAE